MPSPYKAKKKLTTSKTGAIVSALVTAINQIEAADSILEAKDRMGVLAATKDSIRVAAELINKRMTFEQELHKINAPEGFWRTPSPELIDAKMASLTAPAPEIGLEVVRDRELEREQIEVAR